MSCDGSLADNSAPTNSNVCFADPENIGSCQYFYIYHLTFSTVNSQKSTFALFCAPFQISQLPPELVSKLPKVSQLPSVTASGLEALMRRIETMPEPQEFHFIIIWPSAYWIFKELGLPLSQNKYVDAPSLSDKALARIFNSLFSSYLLKFAELKPLFWCQFTHDGTLNVPNNIINQINQYLFSTLCFSNFIFTLPTSLCTEKQHFHHNSLLCPYDFKTATDEFMSLLEANELLSSRTLLSHTVLKDEDHFLLYEEPTFDKPKKATSPFIQCLINGYQCLALADTGSEITLMSKVFFDLVSEATDADLPVLPVTNLCIKGVTGIKSTKVTKQTLLDISIGGKVFRFPALIIPNINSNFILGIDFFQKFGAKLDMQADSLELLDGTVKVPFDNFNKKRMESSPCEIVGPAVHNCYILNKKVVIIADSHGRELYNHLRALLPSSIDLQIFVNPGDPFNTVIHNITSKNLQFNEDDILIVMAGSNNLSESKTIAEIKNEFDVTPLTALENPIIICEIFQRRDFKNNRDICSPINLHLRKELTKHSNIKFLKSSDYIHKQHFTKRGLHLNETGKHVLSYELSRLIRDTQITRKQANQLQVTVRRITVIDSFEALSSSEIRVSTAGELCANLKTSINCFPTQVQGVHPSYDEINTKIGLLKRSTEEKLALIKLLYSYREAFSIKPGLCKTYVAHLRFKDSDSFIKRSYPIPLSKLGAVRSEIQRMLDLGIIERSSGPYSNPIVPVGKKDGDVRVCLDARMLNTKLISDAECPESIEVILSRFNNPKCISTLDYTASFWQIALDKESRDPTSFNFEGKNYRFCVLPFGLCVSMQIFMKALDTVLGPETASFLSKYVDDIKIVSETFQLHLQHLGIVFISTIAAGMTFKFPKCGFLEPETDFLGFLLSEAGIRKDPKKLEAITLYPRPRNVKSLQAFLGFLNFYRKFHNDYSELVSPLLHLLRKDVKWKWGEEEEAAFEVLKTTFAENVVLAYPDTSKPYNINCDSSLNAVSGELYQFDNDENRRPIAFYSRSLTQSERHYTTTELELLSIVACCQKWRQFILGYSTTIVETDHHALTFLKQCHLSSGRLTRWALFLQEFDLNVKFIAGVQNIAIDTLSRYPPDFHTLPPNNLEINVYRTTVFSPDLKSDILSKITELTLADPRYGKIMQELRENPNSAMHSLYIIHDKALFYRYKHAPKFMLCIPACIETEVISLTHSFLGHLGSGKVHNYLKERVIFPKMKQKIRNFVKICLDCQQSKTMQIGRHSVPMIPVLASRNLELVSVDLYGPLPKSFGNFTHVMVCLDIFSKYVRLIPLRNATAVVATRQFITKFVEVEGTPEKVISDHGPCFRSHYWDARLKELNIQPGHTSVYHPQSNPVERYMRTLGAFIRIYCHESHRNWIKYLSFFESCFNSSVSGSTGFTPIEVMKNLSPRNILEQFVRFPPCESTLTQTEKFLMVQENLTKSAERRQRAKGKPETDHPFKVGSKVLVKSHHLSNALYGEVKKFFRLYEGPFVISRLVGNKAFELTDPVTNTCKGVYNLDHLRLLCE